MRAFATLALVGSFALSLFSSAAAAPTAAHDVASYAPVNANSNEADVPSRRSLEARCNKCDANGSKVLDVLVQVQIDIGVCVDELVALKVEDYKKEVLGPILLKIVAIIEVAVVVLVKIAADVKVGAGVGLGAVVGVVVQVSAVASVLVSIIVSIVTIVAHIIVSVGGNVSVCGDALVQIGVQIHALLAVCFKLVVGLKVIVALLLGPIYGLLKVCGFVNVIAQVGIFI